MADGALKPQWFQVLLALVDEPRHGFQIRDAVEQRTGGAMVLWPATLYGVLRDLAEAGLVAELGPEEAPDDDARRKYYRLTSTGRLRLADEAERLRAWAEAAKQGLARG